MYSIIGGFFNAIGTSTLIKIKNIIEENVLVNGKGINMAGCTKAAEGRCLKCLHDDTGWS